MRKLTADEKEIKRWAAARNAHPIERAPFMKDGEPAELGFVFGNPPEAQEHLQPIPWDRFFAIFRLLGLVLAYDGDGEYELLRTEDHHFGSYEGKPMQA